jgi:hypothetical protein
LGEVEGIDVHDGVISVVVVSPSYKIAYVYTYHAAALTPL